MLELIHDARSGQKLEVVVPMFNEMLRLPPFIEHYQEFDLVFLDDGSMDGGQEYAIEKGCTIFRRLHPPHYSEEHFAYYANHVSKSGYTFFIFVDELVAKADLENAFQVLQRDRANVWGRRVDYSYGQRLNLSAGKTPRGFYGGNAAYNKYVLHASLGFSSTEKQKSMTVDIAHLHLMFIKEYIGNAAVYAYDDVANKLAHPRPYWRLFKRYIIYEIFLLPFRLWKERHRGFAMFFWSLCLSPCISLMALLALIEQKYLPSKDKQRKVYARYFSLGAPTSVVPD